MNTLLVIWTVVAMTNGHTHRDWRPIGYFSSETTCFAAAKELEVLKFKCLNKKTGPVL